MRDRAYVVILNWNGRAFIRDCLRAALHQTADDFRIVVVDNASEDGSGDIVREEFPEATLVALPENRHFARGTNAGIETALQDPRCEYVVTLNNDTRVDPEWLEALLREADRPRVGSVASKLLLMDRPDTLNSTGICPTRDGAGVDRGWMQRDEGQFDADEDIFGASAGAALYRRVALETVGLFDGDFLAYYEDLDLAWRIRLAGWECRFAPRSVVRHKYSASTSARAIWKTYQGERNRIWNLVQNYPLAYAALGIPWNGARLLSALVRSLGRRGPHDSNRPSVRQFAGALARARLDAYAGLRLAWRKRAARAAYRKADDATVGRWLRMYGVGIRDMPFD